MSFCSSFSGPGIVDLRAEDFAIATQVFEGGRQAPLAENLTVFQANRIYDFALTAPQRGTVFDAAAGLFRLTDEGSQTQTTLTVDELLQFVAAEQARLASRESTRSLRGSPQFHRTVRHDQWPTPVVQSFLGL